MNPLYPSTIYRVSVKAVIRNEKGEVLVGRLLAPDDIDAHTQWDFPGGGIEHGETEYEALSRELKEEANITAQFEQHILGVEQIFVERRNMWWLGLMYEVTFDGDFTYSPGEEFDELKFVDPSVFKDSPHDTEQYIYKFATDNIKTAP